MSDAHATVKKLSEPFDKSLIRQKPGSKPGAQKYRPATPYISHGLCTKRLNDVAPGWSSRVVEVHSFVNGAGLLTCAAVTLELTIPGVGSRQEVGTANQPRTFGDDLKNAMSDALKRCAMRFGVAIDLWEGMDEADEDAHPDDTAPMPATPAQRPQGARQIDPGYTWPDFWRDTKAAGYSDAKAVAAFLGITTFKNADPADLLTLFNDKRTKEA